MKVLLKRDAFMLVLGCAFLMIPLCVSGIYLINKNQWARDTLDQLEPRHARLLGLQLSEENLKLANQRSKDIFVRYINTENQEASQLGNTVQQQVRSVLTTAGMDISSSQVLPTKEEKDFNRIPLSVRADGDLLSLQTAIAGLMEQRPSVLIDAVNVQGQPAASKSGAPRLTVQFGLSVLKERK